MSALPSATNVVRVTGEAPHPVLWQNRQWAVTEYGVECRDGQYAIAADRLWEDGPHYSWESHMQEKGWVDMADFIVTMYMARCIHSGERPKWMIEEELARWKRGGYQKLPKEQA